MNKARWRALVVLAMTRSPNRADRIVSLSWIASHTHMNSTKPEHVTSGEDLNRGLLFIQRLSGEDVTKFLKECLDIYPQLRLAPAPQDEEDNPTVVTDLGKHKKPVTRKVICTRTITE
uniref:Uncharacterized protein n=1 Tax=Alexandrium andersonii TaxID=327968 RepID=A0A7S2FGU6_9DINO